MTALLKYDTACRAVAEAKSFDEVRDWEDKAAAVREYSRRVGNREMELDALEIRERARRRRGELLAELKAKGELTKGFIAVTGEVQHSLEDLGVSRNASSRDQKIAALDGDSFERLVARCRAYAAEHPEKSTFDVLSTEQKQASRAADAATYDERIKTGGTVEDLQTLIEEGHRFACIYADPPWEFKVYSGKGKDRSADRHYNTGGLDSIMALPVSKLAADDCALLMWAVMPELPGALEVIKRWGFQYKTVGFTWIKQNKNADSLFWGMGYWTRANAELCLLATRGNPRRIAADVHQVVMTQIGEHSRKPEEVQQRIERLVRGPYLELYARRERVNWVTWGNEVEFKLPPHNPETGELIENAAELMESPAASEPACDPSLQNPPPSHAGSPISADDVGDIPTCLRIGHPDNAWRSALD